MDHDLTTGRIAAVKDMLGPYYSKQLIEWLNSIDYFTAPAAKGHHGAYSGGLADHSIQVAKQLRLLTDKLCLTWMREDKSPEIVGLLHDICKVDDYTLVGYEDGIEQFEYNPNKIMPGHGDKSVLMIAGYFNLMEDEARCIQFHMGAFTDKDQWQYYSKAVHDYPNVLYTHTADMIASQILGI